MRLTTAVIAAIAFAAIIMATIYTQTRDKSWAEQPHLDNPTWEQQLEEESADALQE